MKGIPIARLRIYLLLAGLLPLLVAGWFTYDRIGRMERIERELWDLGQKITLREARLAPNRRVREAHRGADHFWVDKELETYLPLKPELAALEQIESWGLPSREGKRRLAHLQSKESRLLFIESARHQEGTMEEVVESTARPIEIDTEDLRTLLALLEGPSETPRPQTLITDFKLQRKNLAAGDELFTLDLKFLKREFSP
ncbi:MAG: hypothetical protein AB7F31_02180 [Parachlamydiales bacterium]